MKYSDAQRIEKMIETTDKLLSFLAQEGISEQDILSKEPIRWAVTTPLYNIGEHSYQLSDSFKEEHPNLPGAKISGLRHRLVHDYDNTNWSLICVILFSVLPDFLKELKELSVPQ